MLFVNVIVMGFVPCEGESELLGGCLNVLHDHFAFLSINSKALMFCH